MVFSREALFSKKLKKMLDLSIDDFDGDVPDLAAHVECVVARIYPPDRLESVSKSDWKETSF